MNNVFISSAKKDEVVENFAKSKREELEKMIPGFVDDRKFTDIVLNFYERGIRDGAQMMLKRMTENAVHGIWMNDWLFVRSLHSYIKSCCVFCSKCIYSRFINPS